MGKPLSLTAKDSHRLGAYRADPQGKPLGGIVVVQEIFGVNHHIRSVCDRLAALGYTAVAPALFDRSARDFQSGYSPDEIAQARKFLANVDWAAFVRDTTAAVEALSRPTAVLGFCMGGSNALRAAIDDKQVFDAAVIFYGKVRWGADSEDGPITDMALAWTDELKIPLMGQFGARDTSIKADDVRAMQARLQVPNDIKIYDEAGHAFFDDTRERYVASAASDAWTRSLAWFGKYLKS